MKKHSVPFYELPPKKKRFPATQNAGPDPQDSPNEVFGAEPAHAEHSQSKALASSKARSRTKHAAPAKKAFTENMTAEDVLGDTMPDKDADALLTALSRALTRTPHPARLDDILRISGISRRQKREVLSTLHAMANKGTLLRLRGGAWVAAASLKTLSGVLAVQRSGAAFLTPVPGSSPFPGGDIYVAPEALAGAWNGDTVEVTLLPGQSGPHAEGRVLRVLAKGQSEVTVRVIRAGNSLSSRGAAKQFSDRAASRTGNRTTDRAAQKAAIQAARRAEKSLATGEAGPERLLCRPADPRLAFDMLVDVSALAKAPQEDELLRVAVGELLPSSPDNQLWSGTAISALGREDDVAVQEQLVKLNHGIPGAFPLDVLAEAERVAHKDDSPEGMIDAPKKSGPPRTDIRTLPLVTIDGADARDFDDAVLVEKLESGWRLLVAIADVASYVLPRSLLDKEAADRGNSYYFPASVEPMLPEALSNGVCSLRPDEDRRVMVADMLLDPAGNRQSARFYEAVMRSCARLTYEQAQSSLNADSPPEAMPLAVHSMLKEAGTLAALLIERRSRHGGLDFDLPEAEFHIENGRVLGVRNRDRQFSHRLIEAFMVCANEAVAEFLNHKSAPLLYRVHPEPGPEKLDSLLRSLLATGLDLPLPALAKVREKNTPHQEEKRHGRAPQFGAGQKGSKPAHALVPKESPATWLPDLLRKVSKTPQAYLVGRLVLRSMMQARYSPEGEGHFGLASSCYCHFTSPIRRYSDLVTHRALKHALGLDPGGAIPVGQKLLAVAERCNSREQDAQNAEREIARRLGCLLLQERVGEEFSGVISGVTHFGLFVELEGMPLEGMIRVESLGRDYFDFDPDRQELRGSSTGVAWRLGENVHVRLVDVHVGRLEVTLELADNPNEARIRGARGTRNSKSERGREGGERSRKRAGQEHSPLPRRTKEGKNRPADPRRGSSLPDAGQGARSQKSGRRKQGSH